MADNRLIAVIGMACRFPGGASSPSAYWRLLCEGTDAIGDVPSDRWSNERFFYPDRDVPGKAYVRRGGFLREPVDAFDARVFGISPREAEVLDPQQRLLLEVSWEALEDAGIAPLTLGGSHTGVYVGGFMLDNQLHLLNVLNRDLITTHTATGSTLVMLSNRLSYTYDLRGPSLSVDTACSSSLVAVHLACQALRATECDLALVGGVNVMLRPEYTIALCKGGFLSPDGACKAFDASGDGYGRGEGAGIVVLKPLRAALRNGDRIRAVIVETGVNQDGRTEGITAPSSAAQEELIRMVHTRAGISADGIHYVEAHGTGTRAGDAAELRALGNALAGRRRSDAPLWVGSVKTNIGHLEAAAGIAGLIKTVLMLEHRQIPPSLHYRSPHPEIGLDALRLRVPSRVEPWPADGPATAAINSFGYGGTNAHAILAAGPEMDRVAVATPLRPSVLPLSAASETALTSRARELAVYLREHQELRHGDVGFTASRLRTHHPYRLAVVAASADELRDRLETAVPSPIPARSHARVVFVYTGMGPQFHGMGADLIRNDSSARAIFERCDAIWRPLAGASLADLFAERSGAPMAAPDLAQPANLVLQLMLTEAARSYGLVPAAVAGHSVGEIAAACVSGALSLKDALRLTFHRSRLQQRLAGNGRMLAVGLSPADVRPYLRLPAQHVEIAAINGPALVTLAGDANAIVMVDEVLRQEQVFSRMLDVPVAYHSAQMGILRAEFMTEAAAIAPGTATLPAYSTVTGAQLALREQDAEYWWRNVRAPVLFGEAMAAMIADGFDTFVEVGPHPVLAASIGACLRRANVVGESFGLQERGQPTVARLLAAIARLYERGVEIDWTAHYPEGNRVSLPAYPWDRQTLRSESEASRADRLGKREHPLLSSRSGEAEAAWEGELLPHIQTYLPDHRVHGEMILPAAAFVEMALAARAAPGQSIAIEHLLLHRSLNVDETPLIRLHLERDGGGLHIYSKARGDGPWTLNASGRLLTAPAPPRAGAFDGETLMARCPEAVDIGALYATYAALGLDYGPAFRVLREAHLGRNEIVSRIDIAQAQASDYQVHPAMLDGALQTLFARCAGARPVVFLPVGIAEIRFHHKAGTAAWCHAVLTREDERGVEGDLVLYDVHGAVSVELRGVQARAVPASAADESWKDRLLYRTSWQAAPAAPAEEVLSKKWLVFAGSGPVGQQLVLDARKHRVTPVLVETGTRFRKRDGNAYEVASESREDLARLLDAVGAASLDAVVDLRALDLDEEDQRRASGTAGVIDLVQLVQELERAGASPGLTLCVATVRAQHVRAGDCDVRAPGQHALFGAGRTLLLERPQLRLKMLDLDNVQPFSASATIVTELLGGSNDAEVAFRGARYVPRVVRWTGDRRRTALSTHDSAYALRGLEFQEIERIAPPVGCVEVRAGHCAISLRNARSAELDAQIAGIVARVGDGVTGCNVGDEVVVLMPRDELTSHVTVPQTHVLTVPRDRGTALLDWASAYHALFDAGNLAAGETILLHGLGEPIREAAVRLAQWGGATVYATADSVAARAALRELGVEHVSDSASLRFVDDVERWTGANGVPLVVNGVDGESREKAIGAVARGGRFVDCSGSSGSIVWPNAETRACFLSDFDRVRRDRPHDVHRIVTALEALFAANGFAPAQREPIPIAQAPDAIRALRGAERGRKAIVDVAASGVPIRHHLPRPFFRRDSTCLLTGGFGGFGTATLDWLVRSGARHIAVLSRTGPNTEEARQALLRARTNGAQVFIVKADISDATTLDTALNVIERSLPPIRGVVHCAGVIDDAALDNLDATRIERVMLPKAAGAWNLHRALADRDLDCFVLFSSVSALLGNIGQAHYAAANAFLDGLALYRRARGLRAVSIEWGVIADAGVVARDPRLGERLRQRGLHGIPSASALALLDDALREEWESFGVFDVDWDVWQSGSGRSHRERFAAVMAAPANDPAAELRRRVLQSDPGERLPLVYAVVADEVCRVLGAPISRVDATTTLTDLGIDSLMAAEVGAAIMARTGVSFRALFIVRGPTIEKMATSILKEILGDTRPSVPPSTEIQDVCRSRNV